MEYPSFAEIAKVSPILASVVLEGNRGHHYVDSENWITCNDGTVLSVIAGSCAWSVPKPAICSCSKRKRPEVKPNLDQLPIVLEDVDCSYPGPYSHLEVLVERISRDELPWHDFYCNCEEPYGDHITGEVPWESILKFIEKHLGEKVSSTGEL